LKIPKTVKVLGRVYKVIRDNSLADDKMCWGYFDSREDIIVLRERDYKLTPGRERQVFLHELIHVLDDSLQIKLSEKQVQLLAVGLTCLIEENELDFRDGK
jgi:hypothetical protein